MEKTSIVDYTKIAIFIAFAIVAYFAINNQNKTVDLEPEVKKVDRSIDSLRIVIKTKDSIIESIRNSNATRVETLTVIHDRWIKAKERHYDISNPVSIDSIVMCRLYGRHCK